MSDGDGSNEVEAIDAVIAGWGERHEDLDLRAMRTFLLLARVGGYSARVVEASFVPHGIATGEFDVLAALVGSPGGRLNPTGLARMAMLSPAGMTNRIDRLEAAGLVEREADPADRRASLVVITREGRALVDRAVVDHVSSEDRILSGLTDTERTKLDSLLAKLLCHVSALDAKPEAASSRVASASNRRQAVS